MRITFNSITKLEFDWGLESKVEEKTRNLLIYSLKDFRLQHS